MIARLSADRGAISGLWAMLQPRRLSQSSAASFDRGFTKRCQINLLHETDPNKSVARYFLVQQDHDSTQFQSMNHPSVDAILINDEIDFPNTATPASCGSGMLKRLLAAPFNAKAKPSMLTM